MSDGYIPPSGGTAPDPYAYGQGRSGDGSGAQNNGNVPPYPPTGYQGQPNGAPQPPTGYQGQPNGAPQPPMGYQGQPYGTPPGYQAQPNGAPQSPMGYQGQPYGTPTAYQAQPSGVPPSEAPRPGGLGTAALALGICALVLGCVQAILAMIIYTAHIAAYLLIISFPISGASLGLGVAAKVKRQRNGLAGLVTGSVGLGLTAFVVPIMIAFTFLFGWIVLI